MYNNCERCDDHIDLGATLGDFRGIFDYHLYGYYCPSSDWASRMIDSRFNEK